MKYLLHIFGCQMNEHDGEVLAGYLEQMGYSRTEHEEDADVILLITCCVREHAESKVYGKIGELARLKQLNPELVLGVCGCMTQQEDVATKMKERFPHLDLIFGTHNLPDFPRMLNQAKGGDGTILEVLREAQDICEGLPRQREDSLKAWVTIMYGCNNFCAYCIVPHVRGRERSREPEAIIEEIRDLGVRGFREVTLLGQNVNSYGKDLSRKVDFADLLAMVDTIPGIERVRYMTSHPRDFTAKLVSTIANSQKVCEHFHLPVQAGSNRILNAMNRGYTREEYLQLVADIRRSVPQAAITTDLIVGFPGETEADYEETLDLVRKVGFDAAFTFAYSPRSGTPAAELEDQLDKQEKNRRLRQLIDLVNVSSLAQNKALVDSVEEVLVEGPSKNDPTRLTARTRTNKLVHFTGPLELVGTLVDVKITSAQTWNLMGEIQPPAASHQPPATKNN